VTHRDLDAARSDLRAFADAIAHHYVFYGRHRKRQPDGTLHDGHKRRSRDAVRKRVLYPAIERANVMLESAGQPTISADVTFHSLRRTFASIAAEAGVDPAWTAGQIGHASARFTIDVYTDVQNRRESPASRIGKLIRGEPMGTEEHPLGTSAQSNGGEVTEARNVESPDPASRRLNSAAKGA